MRAHKACAYLHTHIHMRMHICEYRIFFVVTLLLCRFVDLVFAFPQYLLCVARPHCSSTHQQAHTHTTDTQSSKANRGYENMQLKVPLLVVAAKKTSILMCNTKPPSLTPQHHTPPHPTIRELRILST